MSGITIGGSNDSGNIIIAGKPPEGVSSGSDIPLSTTQIDIAFTPSKLDGIPFETTATYPTDTTKRAGYGKIFGRITDANGVPIKSAIVASNGISAASNDSGLYSIWSPTGSPVEVSALENTETTSVTPTDRLTEVNWQFAGIVVKVRGPNGVPVPNAPVSIGGKNYRTNDQGTVTEALLGLADYHVTILDGESQTVSLDFEGQKNTVTESTGARIDITCYDANTGQAIHDLPVKDNTTGRRVFTTDGGKASLLTTGGQQEIIVGKNDPRYVVKAFETEISDGNIDEISLEVEPNIPTVNS